MGNGSGYPKHLKAEGIRLQRRIITIAAIFEALVADDRPYKKSIDPIKSVAVLKEEAGNGTPDKKLVSTFIEKGVYVTEEMINQRGPSWT
jgi:HD-GYP domain-containing protein (c-di-GMP phosphodiesterase class II)